MFAVHQYRQGVQTLLAACDPELLDTEYAEGDIQLKVPANFYDGQRVDEATLRSMLGGCTMANLVGVQTIGVALSMQLLDEAAVGKVEGVPHAQLMVL